MNLVSVFSHVPKVSASKCAASLRMEAIRRRLIRCAWPIMRNVKKAA